MAELTLSRKESKARRLLEESTDNEDRVVEFDFRSLERRIEDEDGITGIPIFDVVIAKVVKTAKFAWEGLKIAKDALGKLWNVASSLGQWWQFLSRGVVQLLFFDWNQTDEQIDRQIKNLINQASQAWGEFVGFTVGGAANIGAVALIPKIGPMIAKVAAVEFAPEVWGEFKSAVRISLSSTVRGIALYYYKNFRAFIKLFKSIAPEPIKSWLNAWGDGKQPWTIYGALEKAAQAIPIDWLKNFVEGLLEGAVEGWMEAGFLVGDAIDKVIEEEKNKLKADGKEQQTIEVEFDSGVDALNDNERQNKLLVMANPENVEENVTGALVTRQLIGRNDIGLYVGNPAEEFVTNRILLRRLELIFYKGADKPPWKLGNRRAGTVTVTIPNPKKGLKWNIIKPVCRRWVWGRFRAEALLESGRKIVVHGVTADEAGEKVRRFAELSTDQIHAINVVEEYQRNANVKKTPIIAHPARGILLVRRNSNTLTGRTDIKGGRWDEQPIAFELWPDSEPADMPVLL
ncbi:MAG: hypothetical protein ACFCBU_07895 [Cyanophyceae cyanobacterium]